MQLVTEAVTALKRVWDAACPPFGGADEHGPAAVVQDMSDEGLLAVLGALGDLAKRTEALTAVAAGEVARRSPVEARSEGLARRAGYASPGRLIAETRGASVSRAVPLLKVGEATASGRALSGEALPAPRPHVAAALHEGRISVEAAHAIIRMLDRVAPRAEAAEVDAVEETLAAQAADLPFDLLEKAIRYAEARLDTDGLEPREEEMRAARSLTMREDVSGMLHLRGVFDPISGAPIRLALQSYVEATLRASRGANLPSPARTADDTHVASLDNANDGCRTQDSTGTVGPAGDAPALETRTIAQVQADALSDFARHIMGCPETEMTMPNVTMVVRMDLADLEERSGGDGFATIDGIAQPISAGAARCMAATAGLIPAVFGTSSIPLDLGRRARTFSRAQTLALWERDGGCAFCGQTTFVEAHHIRWWQRDGGTTDLSNGVLLCSRCHHRVHRDGWDIRVDGTQQAVSFIPPPHVDPDRRPRPAVPHPRARSRPPDGPRARRVA